MCRCGDQGFARVSGSRPLGPPASDPTRISRLGSQSSRVISQPPRAASRPPTQPYPAYAAAQTSRVGLLPVFFGLLFQLIILLIIILLIIVLLLGLLVR